MPVMHSFVYADEEQCKRSAIFSAGQSSFFSLTFKSVVISTQVIDFQNEFTRMHSATIHMAFTVYQ